MSKMYVQIGGAFLGESGESADSLPAAMWKVEVEGIKLRFTIFLTLDQFYILKL